MRSWYQAPRPSLQGRDRKFVCKDQDHTTLGSVKLSLITHSLESHVLLVSRTSSLIAASRCGIRVQVSGSHSALGSANWSMYYATCDTRNVCKLPTMQDALWELSFLFTRGGMHLVCTFCPDIFTVKVKLQSLIPVHIRKLNFHLNSETRPKAKAILNKQVMIFFNLLKLK
jgi:hypothetical protein